MNENQKIRNLTKTD